MKSIVMIIGIVISMNSNIYFAKDMFNKTSAINKVKVVEYNYLHKSFIKKAYEYYKDNYVYTGDESQEYIVRIYLDSID